MTSTTLKSANLDARALTEGSQIHNHAIVRLAVYLNNLLLKQQGLPFVVSRFFAMCVNQTDFDIILTGKKKLNTIQVVAES